MSQPGSAAADVRQDGEHRPEAPQAEPGDRSQDVRQDADHSLDHGRGSDVRQDASHRRDGRARH